MLITLLSVGLLFGTPTKPIDVQELECLAKNIYYEAPDEPYEGKLAVATVTMNRVENEYYPDTVCEVVYQPYQFSWTRNPYPIREPKIYEEAEQIAWEVLMENKRLKSIGNAMFYHNQTVKPKWSLTMEPIRRIGGHTFYVTRRVNR